MKNEYGIPLDRNGYVPSIIQKGRKHPGYSSPDGGGIAGYGYYGSELAPCRCYLCGGREGYGVMERMERHEPWNAANRQKSKELGLWVNLHRACHEEAHRDAETGRQLRADAQRAAMLRYGWTREEWIRRFGKSELSQDDCARIILTEKVSPAGVAGFRACERESAFLHGEKSGRKSAAQGDLAELVPLRIPPSAPRGCGPLENPGECAGFRVIPDGPELPY